MNKYHKLDEELSDTDGSDVFRPISPTGEEAPHGLDQMNVGRAGSIPNAASLSSPPVDRPPSVPEHPAHPELPGNRSLPPTTAGSGAINPPPVVSTTTIIGDSALTAPFDNGDVGEQAPAAVAKDPQQAEVTREAPHKILPPISQRPASVPTSHERHRGTTSPVRPSTVQERSPPPLRPISAGNLISKPVNRTSRPEASTDLGKPRTAGSGGRASASRPASASQTAGAGVGRPRAEGRASASPSTGSNQSQRTTSDVTPKDLFLSKSVLAVFGVCPKPPDDDILEVANDIRGAARDAYPEAQLGAYLAAHSLQGENRTRDTTSSVTRLLLGYVYKRCEIVDGLESVDLPERDCCVRCCEICGGGCCVEICGCNGKATVCYTYRIKCLRRSQGGFNGSNFFVALMSLLILLVDIINPKLGLFYQIACLLCALMVVAVFPLMCRIRTDRYHHNQRLSSEIGAYDKYIYERIHRAWGSSFRLWQPPPNAAAGLAPTLRPDDAKPTSMADIDAEELRITDMENIMSLIFAVLGWGVVVASTGPLFDTLPSMISLVQRYLRHIFGVLLQNVWPENSNN